MVDPLQRQKTTDRDLEAIQDRSKEFADQLDQVELLGGREIRDITLAVGNNEINHGLDRQPRGWIITDKTASLAPHRAAWDTKTITISSTGPVTINLWIW